MTNATIIAALADLGITGISDWYCGPGMGRVSIVENGCEIAYICNDGRAKVLNEVRAQYGHGLARRSSHPLYPMPIERPFIIKLLAACDAANAS